MPNKENTPDKKTPDTSQTQTPKNSSETKKEEAKAPITTTTQKRRLEPLTPEKDGTIVLDDNGKPVLAEKQRPGMIHAGAVAAKDTAVYAFMAAMQPPGKQSSISLIAGHASTAVLIARGISDEASRGFLEGRDIKNRRLEQSAVIPFRDITHAGTGTEQQLVTDLVALSMNPKTTLDPERRLEPEVVARRAVMAISKSGRNINLHLPELGIRPSPNLRDALRNYTRGGRDQLVAGNLVSVQTDAQKAAGISADQILSTYAKPIEKAKETAQDHTMQNAKPRTPNAGMEI